MRTSASHRAAADTRRATQRWLRSGVSLAVLALALLAAGGDSALAAPAEAEAARPAAEGTARAAAPLRLAEAATAPLLVDGPVRGAAGGSASLPVRIAPGAKSRGRYVVVLKAPDWLSFRGGEQIGAGMWLLDRDRLDSVTMAFAGGAVGQVELSLGLGGKTGAIDNVTPLRVEIAAPAAATVPATTGAIADAEKAITPPAPVAATRTAQAAPPDAPANAPAGFTWEKLIGGDKPAAAPAPAQPAKPAAAAGGKSEAELIQEAKHLVRECTTCHNLYGQDVGIPVMVGLTVDRFLDTMDLYRREKRDHKLMQVISKSLSEEETKALALYLSRIKPAAPSDVAGGGLARMPAPETQASAQQPMTVAKREIDDKTRERIARWLKRGEQMLEAGEIAQARLLLERATEFGDPRAAFLMATSFDPNALPWRPGIGMVAEPLKARRWYLLAKSLGAGAEADQRLADLQIAP